MGPIIIVTQDAVIQAAVQRVLDMRVDGGHFDVELAEVSVSDTIDRVRRNHGDAAIGMAMRSTPEVLEALEYGADEALVIAPNDVTAIHELIDRTWLRGSIRAENDRVKMSYSQTEKLAALGTLVAGVAHEVNNPLAALSLSIEMLPSQITAAGAAIEEIRRAADAQRILSPEDVRRIAAISDGFGDLRDVAEQLEEMRAATRTIGDVVRDLRVFVRGEDEELAQLVRVPELIDQVVRLVGREILAAGAIERDFEPNVPDIVVPRSRMTQVLTNVLINAAHALRDVQREYHRVRITTRSDGDGVAISIADTGPGISPELLDRIFDPFYTTKRSNLGTGLGLSISRAPTRRMGGDLLVESVYGDGATFIILVAQASEEQIRDARKRAKLPAHQPSALPRLSVLVVDEDAHLLRAYSRVLSKHFDVLLATDAQEAIEMLASGSRADVVLADLTASPVGATHLQHWLRENDPALAERTVFVAAEQESTQSTIGDSSRPVLPKPTPASLLVEAIESAARRVVRSTTEA